MDLEAKLAEMQKEVSDGGVTRKTRSAVDWIPRPPEKLVNQYIFSILYVFLYILVYSIRYELSGHRSTITRVVFHPQYR